MYNVGDVLLGERLHKDTSTRAETFADGSYIAKVKAKRRPMLVYGISQSREYNTFMFTTKRPNEGNMDFVLKSNNQPRDFGRMFGFKKVSYLKLNPPDSCPASKLEPSGIPPFPRLQVNEFIKLLMMRCLRI